MNNLRMCHKQIKHSLKLKQRYLFLCDSKEMFSVIDAKHTKYLNILVIIDAGVLSTPYLETW
jgi:hypothetical protein